MKTERSRATLIILSFLFGFNVGSFCFARENNRVDQRVGGFCLVQYEDTGARKWQLFGGSAEVNGDNVKINRVSALIFGKKTSIKLKAMEGEYIKGKNMIHLENNVVIKTTDGMVLTTDTLDWHTEDKNVSTQDEVDIKRANFEVKGKGADVDLRSKTARIKKDIIASAESVTLRDLPDTGSAYQHITILCDGPLEIDYTKNKATFLRNVQIKDTRRAIFADRIDVYFTRDTRRMKLGVARGNVRIVDGSNVTYSDKAIYLVKEGRLVLPSHPRLVIQRVE